MKNRRQTSYETQIKSCTSVRKILRRDRNVIHNKASTRSDGSVPSERLLKRWETFGPATPPWNPRVLWVIISGGFGRVGAPAAVEQPRRGRPLGDLVVELAWILLEPPLRLLAERVTCRTEGEGGSEGGRHADTGARAPLTVVAVVQPDAVAVVLAVAFHGVVAEVALGHLVVGVDDHLRGRERQLYRRRRGGDPLGEVVSFSRLPEKCSSQV